jgi:hypothetical protein
MHDSAPIPPDPESERRGHEVRDVAIRPILIFLICLFVFGGVLQAVMSGIMNGVIIPEARVGVPTPTVADTRKGEEVMLDTRFRDYGDTSRPGDLQRDTTKDMLRMYAKDDEVLASYGYDAKTKKYHIPIERAMQKVVDKGLLKSRAGASLSSVDNELPYPAHSLPYKATR